MVSRPRNQFSGEWITQNSCKPQAGRPRKSAGECPLPASVEQLGGAMCIHTTTIPTFNGFPNQPRSRTCRSTLAPPGVCSAVLQPTPHSCLGGREAQLHWLSGAVRTNQLVASVAADFLETPWSGSCWHEFCEPLQTCLRRRTAKSTSPRRQRRPSSFDAKHASASARSCLSYCSASWAGRHLHNVCATCLAGTVSHIYQSRPVPGLRLSPACRHGNRTVTRWQDGYRTVTRWQDGDTVTGRWQDGDTVTAPALRRGSSFLRPQASDWGRSSST